MDEIALFIKAKSIAAKIIKPIFKTDSQPNVKSSHLKRDRVFILLKTTLFIGPPSSLTV